MPVTGASLLRSGLARAKKVRCAAVNTQMAATATTASTANLLLRNLSERMRPPCMRALDRHVAATCPRHRAVAGCNEKFG